MVYETNIWLKFCENASHLICNAAYLFLRFYTGFIQTRLLGFEGFEDQEHRFDVACCDAPLPFASLAPGRAGITFSGVF